MLLAVWSPLRAVRAVADDGLAAKIAAVTDDDEFRHAHWGLLAVDLASGEVLFEHQPDKLFAPASTTKLFSVATALDCLGADYRFRTPIYARGAISDGGVLEGDLIVVASGDPTMGGRTNAEGRIAYTNSDHTYADGSDHTELTEPDPLAGLDELARQVRSCGISRVTGNLLVDDRLFQPTNTTGSGPGRVTPMMVNDNLIDFRVTPTEPGSPAAIEWRPHTAAYEVEERVTTQQAGTPSLVLVRHAGGKLTIGGQIAADSEPRVAVYAVEDPTTFARTLLIEALARAGVDVDAAAAQSSESADLPDKDAYAELRQVAELVSPPFGDEVRLVLKVSHNLHASMLPILVGLQTGRGSLARGFRAQAEFLKSAGVDADAISFGSGAGGSLADQTTPHETVALLRHMAARDDFDVYYDALPILGVDGTLADSVDDDSPARGKVHAKTGTYLVRNGLNGRALLTSKALAGYMTTAGGREVAFAMFVNKVPMQRGRTPSDIGRVLGRLCEVLYEGL